MVWEGRPLIGHRETRAAQDPKIKKPDNGKVDPRTVAAPVPHTMPRRVPDPARLLPAALAYAARGRPVFPCQAGGKAPLTPHGFKDATTKTTGKTTGKTATPKRPQAARTTAAEAKPRPPPPPPQRPPRRRPLPSRPPAP